MPTHGLGVAVKVDESGRDHTTGGIENDAPAEVGSDRGHARVLDREIHGHVDALAGIDQTSAADHQRKFGRGRSLSRSSGCAGAARQTGGRTPEQETSSIQCEMAPVHRQVCQPRAWKISIGLPDGSSTMTWAPPGPLTISLVRNDTPAPRSRFTSDSRFVTVR